MNTSPSASQLYPLVGSHFRPPASQVLSVLPASTPLTLVLEPDNPYDPLAIQVHVSASLIPEHLYDGLADLIRGTGQTIETLLEDDDIFLGYIGSSAGKPCRESGLPGNAQLTASAAAHSTPIEGITSVLGFTPTGAPAVRVTFGLAAGHTA